jgi:hypothetical protein
LRKVAFLIAASPIDAFYSQIAALAARLRSLAWSNWQPSVHVFVGADRRRDRVVEWLPYLEDVDIWWTSKARFTREGDWAQSDDAIRFAPRDADVLVALDADTFPVTGFETMLNRVHDTGAVAGVIAHYPTVLDFEFDTTSNTSSVRTGTGARRESLRDAWARLAQGLTDVPLDFAHTHTLIGPDRPSEHRLTPFYLNFGVVVFPREAFDAVAPRYLRMRQLVRERMDNADFSGQVALTLAIADARVRTWALPMRYNFPNDPVAEAMYPGELDNVAIVHYLRTTEFDRHRLFTTPDAYAAFLELPLSGVNRTFREAVVGTFGTRYPFPRDGDPSRMRQT